MFPLLNIWIPGKLMWVIQESKEESDSEGLAENKGTIP